MSLGVCLTLLAGTVAADDWVGGLPLTTVQTGTVTGDLYISGNPPSSTFTNVVDRTFTLPAAAVAGSGRVKWARLYVSSYCGHMQDAKKITYTTKADWNNDGTWDNTWTETDNPGHAYHYVIDGGNDNSGFSGHGTGEHYLMLNDHTTRVTSDYLSWYNVTNLIQVGKPTIKVNVNSTGSYDGRIKVVELVVAYDDPSSTTQTHYWVNEGHDSCSYYPEDNEGAVSVGSTTFDTTGVSGITSATLIADYMASSNGNYGFPTTNNNFDASSGSTAVTGSFNNALDRTGATQGPYSGLNSWDVTSSITGTGPVTLGYARDVTITSGNGMFYKIPLAFLVVKKPLQQTPTPVANFTANRTGGTAPLAVQFTSASTGTISSYSWDFNNDGTIDSTQQSPLYTYSTAGTYSVKLTVTGLGGSNSTVKTNYITVTTASTNDLSIAGAVNPQASTVFAKEANTISITNIKNTGSATLTNIPVALYASDVSGGNVPVNTTTISSLTGGVTATVTIIDPTIRNLQGSTVTYRACVDPNNIISETNETNNNKNASKSVKYNGYKGKGLYWEGGSNITTKHTFDLQGNLLYSTQPESAYQGVGWTTRTETWTASALPIPSGSTIESAFLYVAYNWDQTPGEYPKLKINFNGNILDNGNISTGHGTLYTDMSNFGSYPDYEYGLYVYNVTSKFNPSGNSLIMTPVDDNKNALYPSTLVVIYRNSNETRKQIFINEECDELGVSESNYGTTPEEATAYAPFTGMSVDKSNVTKATLYSFAGSAGPDEGNLLFNGNKVTSNAWQGSADSASPLVFNATNYVSATRNEAGIQSTTSGGMDSLQQILILEYPRETLTSPVADFTANQTSGVAPLTVQFTDNSKGNVTSRLWNFGDGTTDTGKNPIHIYNADGTYNVSLTVTGAGGSDSEVKTSFINVTGISVSAPVAAFTSNVNNGLTPLLVQFTDQSTNSPTAWKWEYNNGTGWVQFSTEKNASYSFATACPHDIRLTATNSGGSDDETKLHYIDVATGREPLSTVQSGIVSGDLYISSPTTWNATEVTKSFTLPAAAVGNIRWARLYVNTYSGSGTSNTYALISTVKFDGNGDGTFENTLGNETMDLASETNGNSYPLNDHVNKVYSDYEAQYNVTNLISSVDPSVNVKSQAISGKTFDGRIKGVTLIVAYNDPSSTNQTYYWINHGGDWSNPGNGQTTFNTSGLTSGWTSAESNIRELSTSDANYTFNSVSKTGRGSTPNYDGLNSWNVTDNITAGQSSILAYSKTSGSYKTTLATLKVKYVAVKKPVANFTANVTSGNVPLSVQFNDSSTSSPTSWKWDFNNDGIVDSTQHSPVYTYSVAGKYTVNLTVSNAEGSNSTLRTNYITVAAVAATNDLSIAGTVNPVPASAVFAKEANTVTVTNVKNTGPTTLTNIPIALYASDVSSGTIPVNTTTIASLAGGGTTTVTIIDPTMRNLENSTVTYTAVVDPNNLIPETNEANNSKSGTAKAVKYNGYKGKGLYWEGGSNITTKHTYDLQGNLLYSTQPDSAYKSVGWTDRTETWTASDLQIPSGSTIEKVFLYIAYNWDTTSGGVPNWNAVFNGKQLTSGTPYTDKSNFGGYANYKYGLYAFDTTPEEATAYAPFTGMSVNKSNITKAMLYSFVGSAGPDEGNLLFNGNVVATNAWQGSSNSASPLVFNATNYINTAGNEAGIQSTTSGGMDALQQFLVIEYPKETVKAPVSDFTANMTSGTAPLEVQFTDKSTGNVTSRLWDFGDGTNDNSQNPTHTYTASGIYNVSLTVNGPDGSDSEVKTGYITVNELNPASLVSAFTTTPTSGVAPLTVNFTDQSTGNPTSWLWDFGDGINATEQNPVHVYTSAGIYIVNLTVKNANSTDSASVTINVSEKTAPVLPIANFSTNLNEGYAPFSVQFTDLSENATSFSWDFGDGSNSTEQNPVHTYTTLGNYSVNLTVSNENGTSSMLAMINVLKQPTQVPVASFSSDITEGSVPLSVQFTDLSKDATGWFWDFGDGATSTEQNPVHVYNATGKFTVTLTASNEAGTDVESKAGYITVKAVPSKLAAVFSASPTSGKASLKVVFSDRSTGSPTSWKWSFGDGTYSTASNPVHTYSKAGKYTVSLTVKNAKGSSSAMKSGYIKVVAPLKPPVSAFSASPTSGNAPLKVAFTDRSKGSPTSWKWSFGDGTYSTASNPVHTYSKAGKYTVSLTVKNSVGKSTVTGFNYIKVASLRPPIAAFSAYPTSGKTPLKVTFSDKSTGSPSSWNWSFGDGTKSTTRNPVHTYSKAGKYTITLTVRNAKGSNTKTMYGYITVSKRK